MMSNNGGYLEDRHVFTDDAISRAEFQKRPGLLALLNAAKRREIDAVVCRDETRLGGDTFRTGIVVQDLLSADVRLFYYASGEQVTLDSSTDKIMLAVRNFASELEREKTAQRTREHLELKAKRGLQVGGRVYGYDNFEVRQDGRRSHVEYRVNAQHAEVIREIFRRYAAGEGLRTIAKDLNQRGVPSPTAGRRGRGYWQLGGIQPMLRRERYLGRLIWSQGKAVPRRHQDSRATPGVRTRSHRAP
jgi:site-specific DNA recombinase